jgi:hypothetical protein
LVDFGVSDAPPGEVEVACAAQSAASELRRVSLAFALDVSGSMGNNETRFSLKWLPVVSAAEAFFSQPESAAISASLTFFPTDSADTRCTDVAYVSPDVPETALPSPVFAAAIRDLSLTPGGNWRSSTPTLHAFNGVVSSVQADSEAGLDAVRAVVLVTDGVPQNCPDNDVASVVSAVTASGIRTFVVGVGNPPGAGPADNLDNLNLIAEAGGTGQAFIVETGDPAQTEADFRAVIDSIRGIALSCNIGIPLPPVGTAFSPEQVNVTYASDGSEDRRLHYDAQCASTDSWHYDDEAAPTVIVLCGDACSDVQNDVTAELAIEFGCERRGAPR